TGGDTPASPAGRDGDAAHLRLGAVHEQAQRADGACRARRQRQEVQGAVVEAVHLELPGHALLVAEHLLAQPQRLAAVSLAGRPAKLDGAARGWSAHARTVAPGPCADSR